MPDGEMGELLPVQNCGISTRPVETGRVFLWLAARCLPHAAASVVARVVPPAPRRPWAEPWIGPLPADRLASCRQGGLPAWLAPLAREPRETAAARSFGLRDPRGRMGLARPLPGSGELPYRSPTIAPRRVVPPPQPPLPSRHHPGAAGGAPAGGLRFRRPEGPAPPRLPARLWLAGHGLGEPARCSAQGSGVGSRSRSDCLLPLAGSGDGGRGPARSEGTAAWGRALRGNAHRPGLPVAVLDPAAALAGIPPPLQDTPMPLPMAPLSCGHLPGSRCGIWCWPSCWP